MESAHTFGGRETERLAKYIHRSPEGHSTHACTMSSRVCDHVSGRHHQAHLELLGPLSLTALGGASVAQDTGFQRCQPRATPHTCSTTRLGFPQGSKTAAGPTIQVGNGVTRAEHPPSGPSSASVCTEPACSFGASVGITRPQCRGGGGGGCGSCVQFSPGGSDRAGTSMPTRDTENMALRMGWREKPTCPVSKSQSHL